MIHRLSSLALCAFLLSACNGSPNTVPSNSTDDKTASSIVVLSNRADMLSGDDALLEILLAQGLETASVLLNGEDVSSVFSRDRTGRYIGLLENLKLGDNIISLQMDGQSPQNLTLSNHPNGGPIFSGPQIQPWRCQEGAVDEQCNQPAAYSWLYQSSIPSAQGLQPYDPENPASDVAQTTTDNGQTLPFIVRLETGYQNRDQYKIFSLYDPQQPWSAQSPQAQWNGKLLITHGGNCGAAHASGNAPTDDYAGTIPANPAFEQSYITALGKGYSVLSTALDNAGHNCNIAVQGESLMMAKEHFVEQYGPLRYTIGTGCSGGAIVQYTLANAYPGIYQGILAMCSYPDVFGAGAQFTDSHLLRLYFEDPSRWNNVLWTPNQFADVEGHISHANAVAADEGLYKAALNPENSCSGISEEERFNQETNPAGVRCDVLTYMQTQLGARQAEVWSEMEQSLGRGFAGIPISNEGIQYGLNALREGRILPAQFVDLNVSIGGLDPNQNWQPQRIKADYPALPNMYRTGLSNMANNMDTVAMINFTGNDPGIAHDTIHAFWVRWRIERAFGHHDNHIMWGGPAPLIGDQNFVYIGLDEMSRWLDAIEADLSDKPLADKIISNKPDDMTDKCSDGLGNFVLDTVCPEPIVTYFGTPRSVAGDNKFADTMDCQKTPFSRDGDYGLVPFTEDQWLALETVFADGVCDYSLAPVAIQNTVPWLRYGDTQNQAIIGGVAIDAAPYPAGWASSAFAKQAQAFQ